MLMHMTFNGSKGPFRMALLVRTNAMQPTEVQKHYVDPLKAYGIEPKDILVMNVVHDANDKAPVKLINAHMEGVCQVLEQQNIDHVLVTDAAYFKRMCKLRRAEPYLGYTVPMLGFLPGVQTAYTLNYRSLFQNPSLKSKLVMGVQAIGRKLSGQEAMFKTDDDVQHVHFHGVQEIQEEFQNLLKFPALTLDLETQGLHLKKSQILTAAFAWNKHSGSGINCLGTYNFQKSSKILLREFLVQYKGKLIYHNATFDIRVLIKQLFMKDNDDMKGMLEGLEILFRDIDDTKILTYLATNTTAGNRLSLKEQAFEFVGNYALDDISNPLSIPTEELLDYNITDARATWFVYDKHRPTVQRTQEKVYQEFFLPSLKTIVQTELCGMPLRKEKVQELKKRLQRARADHMQAFRDSRYVKQCMAEMRVEMALDATKKLKKKVKRPEDYEDLKFNPNSTKHLRKLLYEVLGLPVLRFTDTKLASTDNKTITALIRHVEREAGL